MNKCAYCNGELKEILHFSTPILGDIEADLSLWINTGYLVLTLDALDGVDQGDVVEMSKKKIKYCPMCGKELRYEDD